MFVTYKACGGGKKKKMKNRVPASRGIRMQAGQLVPALTRPRWGPGLGTTHGGKHPASCKCLARAWARALGLAANHICSLHCSQGGPIKRQGWGWSRGHPLLFSPKPLLELFLAYIFKTQNSKRYGKLWKGTNHQWISNFEKFQEDWK